MTSDTNFKFKKNPEDLPVFFPPKKLKSGIQIYIPPYRKYWYILGGLFWNKTQSETKYMVKKQK